MDSKSKSQARAKDRISELPDAVLCHILSFLPTKCTSRTSILSTRWKNIWASVPNLDFSDEATSDKAGFLAFVGRLLFSPDSSEIRKFRLHCSSVDDFSHIDSWIRAAIQRNAVEVDLCVESNGQRIFELPRPLLTCKTLEILKLDSNYVINLPMSGSFPSLRSLHVTVDSPDSDVMGTLISFCPVLENLTIDGTLGDRVRNVNISVLELKSLRIRLRSTTYVLHDGHNFLINAPKIESLDIEEDILSNYKLENAKSPVKAHARVSDNCTIRGRDFKRATSFMSTISNVKYLSLSATYLEDLCLPTFGNLCQLKLIAYYCDYWDVPDLLKRLPNLEYFVFEYHKVTLMRGVSEFEWISTESVPICLTSHLKTISIRGLKGEPHDMEMLKYLLNNGEVLEKMTIYTGDLLRTKEELNKEVCMFKKDSKSCQVEFM